MIQSIENKYANLLVDYCLSIKKGEKLYISTTTAAEPLVKEVYREALKRGAIVVYDMSLEGSYPIWMKQADDLQLNYLSPNYVDALKTADAYLVIKAPHNVREQQGINSDKLKTRKSAVKELMDIYNERTSNGSLKRSLCLYPTHASAQLAGMPLDEYQQFVYNACRLNEVDPVAAWLDVRKKQQVYVDRLNKAENIHYLGKHIDIKFSVKDRTWINSDGRTNMPSGEVFTGPVENSVQGKVHFSYPSIYMGEEVENVTMEIRDGKVVKVHATKGLDFLKKILQLKGARFFGEAAIGTNYRINRMTKNILFDEKIGGTIHMALGQSYKFTGGLNQSSIHWDMITDMTEDGQIFTDGELIYEKGKFII